jgi:archaellum component FlaC
MSRYLIAAVAMLAVGAAACDNSEPEMDLDMDTAMEDVSEDARALADKAGEAMKEGVQELEEGAQDLGRMAKQAGNEIEEAVDGDETP